MPPRTSAQADGPAVARGMGSLQGGFHWTIDRMLSVGYGLVYDYIFEQFGPYQKLQAEVLDLIAASSRDVTDRRTVQVLDAG